MTGDVDDEGRAGHRAGYRDALAEPRFRVLFGTRTLAIAADTLRMIALSVLVYGRTGSPLLAAVAYGIGFLPQLVGGALLGSLADRLRPRGLIAGAYALEAGAALALGLLEMPVAAALALVAVVACATPVFAGASNRLVAEVLDGDAYVLGRSLMTMASAAAQLLGLAFGGLAVAAAGARHALLVAAAAHLAAALLVRLRLPDLPPPPGAGGGSVVGESWAGNRRLLADPAVRALLLAQWLPPAFVAGAEGLLVPYAGVRGYGDAAAGALLACSAAGMLLGNLAGGRLLGPAARERLAVPLMALFGLPLLPLALPLPLAAAAALVLLCGCGFAYELGVQRPFVDALPEDGRGQAFGLLSTGLMTLQGVGPVALGALAEVLTVGQALACAGAATSLTALCLRGPLRRAAGVPSAPVPAEAA
ncbi:MFS transporter [Actinomadura sp. NEAU-AAG7]|uniref:MFS transporter n=1 Tax=Actinomadura sp. NEAU-AAG7 TaxID=2839640 RepID=UPI001BE47920|nr:MFS transporter [Actinomadura sp. NEAU-AAG7]MBT2211822.1 MFS transporter [Actinomadura sp. NEAU-AAG7]